MNINANRHRFVLIFLAAISLLTGLWAGIARMGWLLPLPNEQSAMIHGPLMVVGFLGTLIGLERAVALQRWWAYAIPICAGLSALSALLSVPLQISASLAVLASILLIAVFVTLYRQYPSEHFIIMALSALAWLVGNGLWFTDAAVFALVPWWVGYLVLMIAGERLELSRLRQPTPLVRRVFHACIVVILIGLSGSLFDLPAAVRISGLGYLALAVWLLRYDLAWQSAQQSGLPRFMAVSLIAGYLWLATGGILWMVFAQFFSAGPRYDAMLHAVFFGLCLFDDLCARADHIADDHRTGVAVSENFLSPRRFVASIAVFANRWRSFVVAFLATMGWFTERRGDLTFLGQQCACGALGCEYTSHSKKLIPADRAIPENKKLGSYNSYLQQNPKSVSVKESVRRPPLAIQALLPATFVRFSGSILRSFVMQDSFLSRSFPHGS